MQIKTEHESLFFRVFHSSSVAIFITALKGGRMIAFNTACVELLGYPEEVLARSSLFDLGLWNDVTQWPKVERVLKEQGCYAAWEAQVLRGDGEMRDIVMTLELLDVEVGPCVLTFARDMTEQRRVERSLRESEERFRQSFVSASIGKAIVGLDGGWIEVNPALCDLLGYSEEELLQRTFQDITHPHDLDSDLSHVQQMLSGAINSFQMEKRYFHRQGQEVWVLLSVSLVHDPVGLPLYFISEIQDITDRKRYEQQVAQQQLALEAANAQLEQLAITDGLTGLKNRRFFDEHLEQEVNRAARQQAPVSLLMLDIDHFKSYNDAFGHPAGDGVLRQVAHLIQTESRSIDVAARYGGEEFVVVVPGIEQAGAVALAQRLGSAFESLPWPHRAITVSIGIATWMPMATDSAPPLSVRDELVNQADQALYAAKSNGRNHVMHAGWLPQHASALGALEELSR